MNSHSVTLAALLAMTPVVAAQDAAAQDAAAPDAAASAVAEAPDAAVLTQLQAGAAETSVQARYRTVSDGQPDLRGVAQSFVWPSDRPLDVIGLKLSGEQGSVDAFDEPQDYVVEIHKVDGMANDTPSSEKLAEAAVTIEPAHLEAAFVAIDLPEAVALEEDGTYLFHLRPAAEQQNPAVQRLYFARSDDGDPYADGVGNQTDGQPRAAGGTFGSRNYDLLFYPRRRRLGRRGGPRGRTDVRPRRAIGGGSPFP